MSAESRIEDFILAPSDPAWGDERNREEYYRAMAVGYYWAAPAALIGSLIAAAEGARVTAMAVLLLLLATQLATYRYCSRHHVPLAQITRGFLTPKRKAAMAAILIPYLAIWCALTLEKDASTIAGAAAGGLVGAGIAVGGVYLAARSERRREAEGAADDDVFE